MLRRLVNKLESKEYPLLGPNVKALKFWGLLLPNRLWKIYFYLFIHINIFIFTATEYVDIWFVRSDMNMILNNLKISMLSAISVFKVTTILYRQKDWLDIIDYVTRADLKQRRSSDSIKSRIIYNYTKYSRRITFFYWSLVYSTGIVVVFQPVLKYFLSSTYRDNVRNGTEDYLQVVSSWLPFDKNTVPGYIAASIYQSFVSLYATGWITSYDTNAIVTMIFFKGELELLRRDSADIFGSEKDTVSDDVVMDRLKECHRRHVELVKFARLFKSCLSPIMLLYMLICSVMLCTTAYQITIETDPMQRFMITEYLAFGIAQLFMYCWHSNDVLYTSQDLSLGPYESAWWSTNSKRRKELYILTAQFRKRIVFTAGPFTDLTVATFIGILKGAYSYYTLLTKSDA